MEQSGEYLWLKQSATFTINGQTRTVEIAVPLRPGATADEVEALLSEADAGMERLARHLDARVAALIAPDVRPAAAPEATASEAARPAETPARPATPPAPGERPLVEQPPALAQPRATTPQPAPEAPPRSPVPSRPTTPATATPASPRPTAPPAPASAQTELTRPEFIAALKDIGLDVREAMQKLGVRSLEGLNLREALESLRRQSLRAAGGESATPTSEATRNRPAAIVPPRAAPARNAVAPAAPAAPPRYFEEEDEPDVEFSVAGADEADDLLPDDESAPNEWDDDADDLDDVPDFGPPAASHRGPASGRAPHDARPAAAPAAHVDDAAPPSSSGDPAMADLLARLRAAQGGGTPSSQQRTAYRNIIVNEIGETTATYLVRGIWRVTPERLGPEQMDELLSWGKQDTFGDDARKLVTQFRAERAAEENGSATGRPAPRTRARPLATSDPSGGA